MGDLGKLIVAKGFKNCPKSNKSPNLVTLFPGLFLFNFQCSSNGTILQQIPKFKNHYIKNIYNFHYINDRNNRLIELELMQFDTKLYKLFLYSTTTFIFKLLYFFPNLGKTIVNLKKRIIEKSIL